MQRILDAVGDHTSLHEVLENYERFKLQPDPSQFAIIKIGGALLKDVEQKQSIAKDAAALSQIGLYPPIVYGAGPQLDAKFAQLSLETPRIRGNRRTPLAAAPAFQAVLQEVGLDLLQTMRQHGAEAAYIPAKSGVLTGSLSDPEDIASVQNLQVNTNQVKRAIASRKLPIISSGVALRQPLARGAPRVPSKIGNVNADTAGSAIGLGLGVKKYISLTEVGAVLDRYKQPINQLNSKDVPAMIASGEIYGDMIPKVEEAVGLIAQGIGSVAITSPKNLLLELFSNAGKGTLVT